MSTIQSNSKGSGKNKGVLRQIINPHSGVSLRRIEKMRASS
jgi:hypothetical protein